MNRFGMLVSSVVIASAFFVACDKKDDREQINVRGDRGMNGIVTPQNVNGNVGIWTGTNPTFQNALKSLCGTDQLGSVDGTGSDPRTGVRFGGLVNLSTNGTLLQANGNVGVSSSSSLSIEVYDSLIGQIDPSTNQPYTAVKFSLANAQGTVNVTGGVGSADITFSDNYGWVRLTGQISSTEFSGTVSFQNNGESVYSNFAQFRVNKCGFFRCQ